MRTIGPSLMVMGFRVGATIALGGILLGLPAGSRATTIADLCPAAASPCIVSRTVRVDDGSVIDAGTRHLLIASGGALLVDSGTMTLKADRVTVQDRGALRALGNDSQSGGSIIVMANEIQVMGIIQANGDPGGDVSLTSAGPLNLTGSIEATSRSRDEDGGNIDLIGVNVDLAGAVTANGGQDGIGGDVDVSAGGDLVISRNVEASGGDGGSIDLSAGTNGAGSLTVSQNARVEANAVTDGGIADSIVLTANGDGIAVGHIVMNGRLAALGGSGASAGEISLDAAGDVRGSNRTARIVATGGRPDGAGGDINITARTGQFTSLTTIEARGSTEAPGGSLTFDVGGSITFSEPIDVRGGTAGGSIVARAAGDISVDTTLRSDSAMDGGALIDFEACSIFLNAMAVLSSEGPNGINRLTGRDLTFVRGTMLANFLTGLNEIRYAGPRNRPVILDSADISPSIIETEDPSIPLCGPVLSPTPSRTPTATRAQRTASPTPSPTVAGCVGDCDGDGRVVVNELVVGVNISLERQALATCPRFDPNGSRNVSVDELIRGVNNALRGCP